MRDKNSDEGAYQARRDALEASTRLDPTRHRNKKAKKSRRRPKRTAGRGSSELIARQAERREERLARIRAALQKGKRKQSEEQPDGPATVVIVSKEGKPKGKRKAGKRRKGRAGRPGGQSVRTYSGGLPGLSRRKR
jgi:hypothetical protein